MMSLLKVVPVLFSGRVERFLLVIFFYLIQFLFVHLVMPLFNMEPSIFLLSYKIM